MLSGRYTFKILIKMLFIFWKLLVKTEWKYFFFFYYFLGLCGNFNGNPKDDFKDPNSGKILKNPNDYGNLFQIKTKLRFDRYNYKATIC